MDHLTHKPNDPTEKRATVPYWLGVGTLIAAIVVVIVDGGDGPASFGAIVVALLAFVATAAKVIHHRFTSDDE